MAHRDVETAVKARLEAGFTTDVPIYDEDEFTVPTDGRGFIVIQFPYNENWQRSFEGPNGRHFTEEGGFRFVIGGRRKGERDTVAMAKGWAHDIAELFRGAEFDGIRCFAPSSPVGDNSNDQGGYYFMSVVVPYEFTYLHQG